MSELVALLDCVRQRTPSNQLLSNDVNQRAWRSCGEVSVGFAVGNYEARQCYDQIRPQPRQHYVGDTLILCSCLRYVNPEGARDQIDQYNQSSLICGSITLKSNNSKGRWKKSMVAFNSDLPFGKRPRRGALEGCKRRSKVQRSVLEYSVGTLHVVGMLLGGKRVLFSALTCQLTSDGDMEAQRAADAAVRFNEASSNSDVEPQRAVDDAVRFHEASPNRAYSVGTLHVLCMLLGGRGVRFSTLTCHSTSDGNVGAKRAADNAVVYNEASSDSASRVCTLHVLCMVLGGQG